MYLFTGMRTAQCRRLGVYPCISAEEIVITHDYIAIIGRTLSPTEMTRLAEADGFASTAEFVAFFQHEHTLPLTGQLIRW